MTSQSSSSASWYSIVLLGVCIGALAGLSGSPIGGTLLAALLAAATLALSVMGGFDKGRVQESDSVERRVDIKTLAIFSLAVLLAIVPASFVRSEILRVHSKNERVRLLSPPPALEEIIASWQKVLPLSSHEEITSMVLKNHTSLDLAAPALGAANPSLPILLNTSENTSLVDSCVLLRHCGSDAGDTTSNSECLRRNFIDAMSRGGKAMSSIARILEENILDSEKRHLVFGEISTQICEQDGSQGLKQ